MIGNHLLNHFNRYALFIGPQNIAKCFLCQSEGNFRPFQRTECDETYEGAFKFTYVRFDFARDVQRNIVWEGNVLAFRLFANDCNFRLKIRRLDIRDETPFESGMQTLFKRWNCWWRTICRYDDLL